MSDQAAADLDPLRRAAVGAVAAGVLRLVPVLVPGNLRGSHAAPDDPGGPARLIISIVEWAAAGAVFGAMLGAKTIRGRVGSLVEGACLGIPFGPAVGAGIGVLFGKAGYVTGLDVGPPLGGIVGGIIGGVRPDVLDAVKGSLRVLLGLRDQAIDPKASKGSSSWTDRDPDGQDPAVRPDRPS